MRKFKNNFVMLIVAIFLIGSLAGCSYQTPRKVVPTPYKMTKTGQPLVKPSPYTTTPTRTTPGTTGTAAPGTTTPVGMRTISATFEMLDFTYSTVAPRIANVHSGISAASPVIAKLAAGQKVRVLGKYDGSYVIVIPNTNRLGCVTNTALKPYTTTTTGTALTPAAKPIPKPAATAGTAAATKDAARILQLCNAERAKVGAPALKASSQLNNIATLKSQDMVNNNYFSHQSPTYGSPFDMMKTYGVTYMYAGENIAMYPSADKAFAGWMGSEGHRKNILNPNFTELGVGVANKGNGSYIFTQEFIGK